MRTHVAGLQVALLIALSVVNGCGLCTAFTPPTRTPPTLESEGMPTLLPTLTTPSLPTPAMPASAPPAATLVPSSTPDPPTDTPAPPTPSREPTATPEPPTPTQEAVDPTPVTLTPGQGPVIVLFRSSLEEADPGDTILLEWQSLRATRASLYHLLPSGQFGAFWPVETSGSMVFTIAPGSRNPERFMLFVSDDADNTVEAGLTVEVRCPDTWFFAAAPDECPSSPPALGDAAEEHFERGVMLWIKAEDRIYVLFSDGQQPAWRALTDEWDEGEPIEDPNIAPPEGLLQPARGFGLVWRETPGVRDRLGWAVDAEEAFATAIQSTARFKYNVTYFRALDGGAWELGPEGSRWEHLP